MALRKGSGLLAGMIPFVAAGAILACGGDSPLDVVPTPTTPPTNVSSQPTQVVAPTSTAAAPVPTETPGAGGQQTYVVQAGDTLGAIAAEFGVTVDAIVQANEITDPNLIVPGETLVIPPAQ